MILACRYYVASKLLPLAAQACATGQLRVGHHRPALPARIARRANWRATTRCATSAMRTRAARTGGDCRRRFTLVVSEAERDVLAIDAPACAEWKCSRTCTKWRGPGCRSHSGEIWCSSAVSATRPMWTRCAGSCRKYSPACAQRLPDVSSTASAAMFRIRSPRWSAGRSHRPRPRAEPGSRYMDGMRIARRSVAFRRGSQRQDQPEHGAWPTGGRHELRGGGNASAGRASTCWWRTRRRRLPMR